MKYLLLFAAITISTACSPTITTTSDTPGQKQKIGTLSGMIIGGALANDMADGPQ